ncbi:MAG: uroporphyrinogen-III C-methyltransferase [Pigmentiphaga sp.]
MNDSDTKSAADGANAGPLATPESGGAAPAATAMERAERQAADRRRALSRWLGVGLAVAVVVIVALAATLRHQQTQLNDFGREATRRLDEAVAQAQEARRQAQEAHRTVQGMDRRLAELDSRTQHTEAQQDALEAAWHELAVGAETSVLVDVEQSLLLAAEQLQLAGRVPSAIAALQAAEARLSRAARPAYRSAQQAVARDLKRLQALPYQDFALAIEQIDGMLKDIAQFPLKAPGLGVAPSARQSSFPPGAAAAGAPDEPSSAPETASGEWWEQAWGASLAWAERTRNAAVTELNRLVEVRRVDQPDALLLSADQADILRANLALRLIEARMALLARLDALWVADLDTVRQAIQRYGEPNSPITRRLLRQLDELRAVDPVPTLPSLSESLKAVRGLLSSIEAEPLPGGVGGAPSANGNDTLRTTDADVDVDAAPLPAANDPVAPSPAPNASGDAAAIAPAPQDTAGQAGG